MGVTAASQLLELPPSGGFIIDFLKKTCYNGVSANGSAIGTANSQVATIVDE